MLARVVPVAGLVAAFLLAYAFDVGRGFIKDDFVWLHFARMESWRDIGSMFVGAVGFYRPLVTLSFAIDRALFGLAPLGFGLTNLALAAACAVAWARLARTLGLPAWAALYASALWAFNFHGINMAILWVSGRTALLATLFAVFAGICLTKQHRVLALLATLAGMLSKEEVIALPFVLACWAAIDAPENQPTQRSRLQCAVSTVWPLFLAVPIYLIMRSGSGAWTPTNAPAFYQFTFSSSAVAENLIEYADRSSTFAAATLLIIWLVERRRPKLDARHRAWMLKGLVWWIGGFAVTLWLPVRSSLYAVLPSIGSTLVAAALAVAMLEGASRVHVRRLAIAGLVLPFVLLPVYWQRNVRWSELADLSTATIERIASETQDATPGTIVELIDDRSQRANFASGFGTETEALAAVVFDGRVSLWIEPPPPEVVAAGVSKPTGPNSIRLRLRNGVVERE